MFHKLIIATSALVMTSGIAFAQTTPSETSELTPTLDVANAKMDGANVVGVSVMMDKPGYVVLHDEGAGAPPANIGHIAVDAGENSNLSIPVTGTPTGKVSVMLHAETNENNTYDFGPGSTDVDTPIPNGTKELPAM